MKRIATGIVMEIYSKNAVIMTQDGEFLKVKKPSSQVDLGEEITAQVADDKSFSFVRYGSIAAAIILMFIPFIYFKEAYATVAYIDVDINPSLEIGIDKYNRVRKVIPLNDDAKALLENMALKNKDINEALDSVITGAMDMGYIKEDAANNIEISLVKLKDGNVNISEEKLVEYAESAASKINVDATIEVHNTDKKVLEEAKKENMSTNKYLDRAEPEKEPANTIKKDVKKQEKPEVKENNGNQDKKIDEKDKDDNKEKDDKKGSSDIKGSKKTEQKIGPSDNEKATAPNKNGQADNKSKSNGKSNN